MESTPCNDYQTESAIQQRWNRVHGQSRLEARMPGELNQWQQNTVALLKRLTGYNTMVACAPEPRLHEVVQCDGYVRRRIDIRTEPGIRMPFYVLEPDNIDPPYIPVVAAHGHSSGGKAAVAGVDTCPQVRDTIRHYHYDYGVNLAKAGFMVFCPDARGFGERRERLVRQNDNPLASSCLHLSNMAIPLGQTVTGMWVWDIHRLLDYVASLPACSAMPVGCVGLSGGGLQTLWAAALDERIRAAIVSGYFYGYRQSLLEMHHNCSCNYVPHLYEHLDMGDIGALVAPRALRIETGTRDPLNGAGGLANVTSQLDVTRRAYALYDATDRLAHHVFEGEHRWDGAGAVDWLRDRLAPPDASTAERTLI